MGRPLPVPPPGFDDLPVDEQLDYVEALWDRIVASPDDVAVPEWHRQILRERLAEYRSDGDAARPWPEIRDELLRDLSGRERKRRG